MTYQLTTKYAKGLLIRVLPFFEKMTDLELNSCAKYISQFYESRIQDMGAFNKQLTEQKVLPTEFDLILEPQGYGPSLHEYSHTQLGLKDKYYELIKFTLTNELDYSFEEPIYYRHEPHL